MATSHFCSQCGTAISSNNTFCTKCGAKLTGISSGSLARVESEKSGVIALILCILFGVLGVHRFYVGKIGTGILMLLTGGGFFIWVVVDLVLIISNDFEDKQGRVLVFNKAPTSLKKVLTIIFSFIAALFVFVVSLLMLAFYLTSGLVGTINNQLSALRAGDINAAYSYTSIDFQHATSLEQFKQFVDHYPSLKNNESSTFSRREISNDEGTVEGTLYSKEGAATPVTYHLIKENGEWKILNIELKPIGMDVKSDDSSEE